MAKTYELISSTVLTSAQSSVVLSSIPQTYTDLILIVNAQKTTSGSGSGFSVRFNGDTGTNYSAVNIEGSGSAASSYRSSNGVGFTGGALTSSANTANFDINQINIMNYASSSWYKTSLIRYNDNEYSYVGAEASLWRSTAAINSITLYVTGTNFAIGSNFYLYGIKAA